MRPNLDQRFKTNRNNNIINNKRSNLHYDNNVNNNLPNLTWSFSSSNKRDSHYVLPAFWDMFSFKNATYSKLDCTIVINDPLDGKLDQLM